MDLNRCSFSWYSWAKIYAGIDIKKSKIDISGIGYDIHGPKIDAGIEIHATKIGGEIGLNVIDIHGPKICVPSLYIHGSKIYAGIFIKNIRLILELD